MITSEKLGSEQFKQDYNIRFSYVAGAMVKGIASTELVIAMGKAGFLAFYGSGGMNILEIETAIMNIRNSLNNNQAFGVNLLSNPSRPETEAAIINLLLRLQVRNIEASAYMQISPALVMFRLHGATFNSQGIPIAVNKIMAKISRPEIAYQFLNPAPVSIIKYLINNNLISEQEALVAEKLPLASDICVESDSGGHTDMGVTSVLLPTVIKLRNELQKQYPYIYQSRVGAGGGIGTPQSAACAFMLGAEFIVTGSINQCTIEAGMSDSVKDMLEKMEVQDRTYAPSGDMFEFGSKIQVFKKGVLFPYRANKLYDLWRNHSTLQQIDATTRKEIQEKYFRRSFEEVYTETKTYYEKIAPAEIEKAERNPKAKMALIFRWYFVYSMRLAINGIHEHRINYQIHTGPALGAYNQWIKGSTLEKWRNRNVAVIAEQLMEACAEYMNHQFKLLF